MKCLSRNALLGAAIKLLLTFYQVSNFNSLRALDFQSCFILSSQSPLLVIQTCFPLLGHLSSELQVLIHVEGQVERIILSAITYNKAPQMTKTGSNFTVKKFSRFDASYCQNPLERYNNYFM